MNLDQYFSEQPRTVGGARMPGAAAIQKQDERRRESAQRGSAALLKAIRRAQARSRLSATDDGHPPG